MPFGLRDVPGPFQTTLNVIFPSVKWQFALVYQDYIMVLSETPKQHIDHYCTVTTLLRDADVTL